MYKSTLSLLLSFIFISLITNAQKKLNDTENYKKHNWEAGITLGTIAIFGDVKSLNTQLSYGFNLSKALTKWFSLNLKYTGGNAKGLNTISSYNFAKNIAWSDKYAAPIRQGNGELNFAYVSANGTITPATNQNVVFYNYKTSVNLISLLGKFSFTIPQTNPEIGFHFSIGGGALNYKTKVNAKDANGTYANLFNDVNDLRSSSTHSSDALIKQALQDGMDKSYETNAERHKEPSFCQSIGYGISFTFKKRFVIGVEQSLTFIKTDLLDGQRWQEQAYGDAVLTRDFDHMRFNNINLSYLF